MSDLFPKVSKNELYWYFYISNSLIFYVCNQQKFKLNYVRNHMENGGIVNFTASIVA